MKWTSNIQNYMVFANYVRNIFGRKKHGADGVSFTVHVDQRKEIGVMKKETK